MSYTPPKPAPKIVGYEIDSLVSGEHHAYVWYANRSGFLRRKRWREQIGTYGTLEVARQAVNKHSKMHSPDIVKEKNYYHSDGSCRHEPWI